MRAKLLRRLAKAIGVCGITAGLPVGALAPVAARPAPAMPEARVETGTVIGKRDGAVMAFLGVPYAGDTGGANRWRAPRSAPTWHGKRAATAFGADCYQDPPYIPPGGSPWSPAYFPTGTMSEDCLALNVWTPSLAARKPVLIWIHGGGFAGGSGSVPIYDGAPLARHGIVVVSINYRVGVFGFLAHPGLTTEAGSSGNYGLMDQVAALRWVRRNIARFGGDPDRVTIAGQSAGAASVHALLAAPSARGLFRQAVAQSGSGMGIAAPPLADAEAQGVRVAAAAGAADIGALRRLSAEAVARASHAPAVGPPGLRFVPITEPKVLPDPAAERGDVPVLTGLTADEASTAPDWQSATAAGLTALLGKRFGAEAQAFAPFYARSADTTLAARSLLRDQATAAMLLWAEARAPRSAPVYGYRFDHPQDDAIGRRFGSFHTSEVPYVLGTVAAAIPQPRPADRALETLMGRYWVNFVLHGDPNGQGLPAWPTVAGGHIMMFDAPAQARAPMDPTLLATYRAFAGAGGKLALF
ncbi:carboxylesterase family protein [Sphingomonas sp. RB3P16]|uniref:carboxylesterase/lipase family protein n=1 Tax=Parasphingomonas frigoris TaxID=3096163 RepID=UPI002FC74F16